MENIDSSTRQLNSAAPVSPAVQRRIDQHLLTCSAATVGGVVALATGAQAAIVVSPANINVAVPVTTASTPRVYFDFDTLTVSTGTAAPAGTDLSLLNILSTTANGYFKYNRLFAIGATTATGTVLDAQTANQVGNTANFGAGIAVNSASPFHQFGALAQHFYSAGGAVYNYGNFTTTGTSYIGFDFLNTAGQTRYGWMQVTFNATAYAANQSALTVNRYAYDNTGVAIATGAVPEPGEMALGCLAAGATGLAVWRRRRAEKVA